MSADYIQSMENEEHEEHEEQKVLATIFVEFRNYCKKRKLEYRFGQYRLQRILDSLKQKNLIEFDGDGIIFLSRKGLDILGVK